MDIVKDSVGGYGLRLEAYGRGKWRTVMEMAMNLQVTWNFFNWYCLENDCSIKYVSWLAS